MVEGSTASRWALQQYDDAESAFTGAARKSESRGTTDNLGMLDTNVGKPKPRRGTKTKRKHYSTKLRIGWKKPSSAIHCWLQRMDITAPRSTSWAFMTRRKRV